MLAGSQVPSRNHKKWEIEAKKGQIQDNRIHPFRVFRQSQQVV